jgi:serpin B
MDLILPAQGKTVSDVANELTSATWNSWVLSLGTSSEVDITLPPFKFEYEKELNDVLSNMGMTIAFDPYLADFSGINNQVKLFISKVAHKTYVEVNEEGTEAAAVTSVGVNETSAGPSFVFNRPFIFVIREITTGTILFIGKLGNPER